jgi:hypothetical protein
MQSLKSKVAQLAEHTGLPEDEEAGEEKPDEENPSEDTEDAAVEVTEE